MSLPTDDKSRKGLPIFRGPLMYFPDALLALAAVCKAGNDQHNPGEPLHWAREKSTEQLDTALRHMMDHGTGTRVDIDGMWHLAKAAWRILAELQLSIEESRGEIVRGKDGVPRAPAQAVPQHIPQDPMLAKRVDQAMLEMDQHKAIAAARGLDDTVKAQQPMRPELPL